MSYYAELLLHVSGLDTAFRGLSFSRSHKAQGSGEKADQKRVNSGKAQPGSQEYRGNGSRRNVPEHGKGKTGKGRNGRHDRTRHAR